MTRRADIVPAEPSHIAEIAEIEKSCIPDGWSEKLFADALESENTLMFTALDGENVVGFLNGSYVLDEGELLNIAVHAEYRKSGIAGRLLERFEQALAEKGVGTVYLEVRESNAAARNLYQKHGYTQNGLRKNYYRSPSENAVLMMKRLHRDH